MFRSWRLRRRGEGGGAGGISKLVLNVQAFECVSCIMYGNSEGEGEPSSTESVGNEEYDDYRRNDI